MAFTARAETVASAATIAAAPWNFTINKATGVVDGDIMFMFLTLYGSVPTVDSVPAGWQLIATNITSSASLRLYLYYKIASGEGTSYTWSLTGSCRYYAVNAAYTAGDWSVASLADITAISNTLYATAGVPVRAASMNVPNASSCLLYFAAVYSTTSKTFTKPSVPTTGWVEDSDAGGTTPDIWATNGSMIWASSGATGIIEITCSATITTEKHAFAISLKPASTLFTLTIQEAFHSNSADAPVLTQVHTLVVADTASGLITDSVAVIQVHNLIMLDTAHGQIADGDLVLIQEAPVISLVVSDAAHALVSDVVVLTQVHTLIVAETEHGQTVDVPVLTQVHLLIVADVGHGLITDAVVLTQVHNVLVVDATHSSTVDSLVLTQVHNLTVPDARHGEIADAVVVSQVHNLITVDAVHEETADSVVLTQVYILGVQDAIHEQTADAPVLTQVHTLIVQDAIHVHTADTTFADSSPRLAVFSTEHGLISDISILTQVHTLVPSDTAHAIISLTRGTICDTAVENTYADLTAPVGAVFIRVDFASFGTPNGICPDFTLGGCNALISQSVVEGYLLGNNSASVPASNGIFGDPCPGTVKRLYITTTWELNSPILTQVHILMPTDTVHGQTADNIILSQSHILEINDSVHEHITDNISFDNDTELIVFDAVHEHLGDIIELTQMHLLTVDDAIHLLYSDYIPLNSSDYTNWRDIPINRDNKVVGGLSPDGFFYCRICIERTHVNWESLKYVTRRHTNVFKVNCSICGWKLSRNREILKRIKV